MVHILILGASGRTGKYGVQYALENDSEKIGYTVTAIVRDASSLPPHKKLNISIGSVYRQEDVDRAVDEFAPFDGVAVFLNMKRISDNPWSKVLAPPMLITTAVKNILTALQQIGKTGSRIVVMSALGVGNSWDVTSWMMRFLVSHSNMRVAYEDHNAIDRELPSLCGDKFEWTLVRATMLKEDGRKTVRVFGGDKVGAGSNITRQSCAEWMVDVASGVEGSKYSNKAFIVSN